MEERDPGQQRQCRGDDDRVARVQADDRLAQQVDGAAEHGGDRARRSRARPSRCGAHRPASPAPMRCATSTLDALAIASGSMNISETMLTAIWCPATAVGADARDEEGHEGEAGNLDQDRQAHRHAEAAAALPGCGGSARLSAAAQAEARVERVAPQQHERRQQLAPHDDRGGDAAARAPSAGRASVPKGVGRAKPKTSRALSGIFSARPPSCSAITAFGRETATLKPR